MSAKSFMKYIASSVTRKNQKLPKNVGDLYKLTVAKGFKKLTKVQ